MAPDDHDHEHQGGNPLAPQPQQNVSPAPLLPKTTATIYLDGLIYAAYNKNRKVLESAILTTAEKHHLLIEVRERGKEPLLFPTAEKPWAKEHEAIKNAGPFWLYVDSGNKIKDDEFSAELHTEDDDRSFNNIFNFEEHHHKPLPVTPGSFALFNFPHGTSYSAETKPAELKRIPANGTVANAKGEGEIPVSNLAGIDIDAVSDGAQKKSIVLANQDGRNEFFRFELEPGKQYEIKIENRPVPNSNIHDHEKHFLQFYELFGLDRTREPRFLVIEPGHGNDPHPASGEVAHPPTADNPPCAPGRGGGPGGLGGG
jgi:hypothetical protein